MLAAEESAGTLFSDIDEQRDFWESMHDVVDGADDMTTGDRNDAHDIIDGLLVSVNAFEKRQRPLRFLDLPAYNGVLGGGDATTILLGRYSGDEDEWQDEHLIELPDAPAGQRAAAYLAEFAERATSGAASTITWDSTPPLLFQLIDKTFTRTQALPSAKSHMNTLAALPPRTLERLMRETIGLGTHRLDAWMTSLASNHLTQMRAARPEGIQIGAFGWVQNLKPGPARPSNGYIHAPSLAHATTAAVLRSAWHAHGTDSATSAAAVNANSKRIRTAEWMLDGVRNGQELGELLGYRFERLLHDHALQLDDQIRDVRLEVLRLHTDSDASEDEPVDGLALLDEWRAGNLSDYLSGLESLQLRAPMEAQLTQLERTFDAVSDVALFESTHHLIQGNLDRAGAMNQAINLGSQAPPELRAQRTGRDGTSVEHRLVLLLDPDAEPPSTRSGWSTGLRDQIAPALEAWLCELLPAPDDVGFAAAGSSDDDVIVGLTLADLGLSALDAVHLASPDPTLVDRPLAGLIRSHHKLSADTRLLAEDGLDRPWSLAEFQLLAAELRAVFDIARPADARDLRPGYDSGEGEVGLDSIVAAIDTLWKTFADAVGTGELVTDTEILRRFGVASVDSPQDAARLRERAKTARTERKGTTLEGQSKRAARLFGAATPVLPSFPLTPGPEGGSVQFDNNLAAEVEVLDWLDAIGAVRRDVGRLTTASLLADLAGSGDLHARAGQDHIIDNERWAALAAPTPETGGRLSVCAIGASDAPSAGGQACGLMIDQWSERIPRSDQLTGVSFHFDAPSNKPPQAWILAMPPDGEGWELDNITGALFPLWPGPSTEWWLPRT